MTSAGVAVGGAIVIVTSAKTASVFLP